MKKILTYKFFFFILFLITCLWMTLQPIPIADLWWQLRSGQLIFEQKGIPSQDPFSYTAYGQLWINHEWLACLFLYVLFSWGGFSLLYAMKSLTVISSYLFTLYASPETKKLPPVLMSVAALWMLFISEGVLYFDIRPYLFTYICLALTLWLLQEGYYKNKPKMLLFLAPITLLWVNTHGGYILSYILQFLFLLYFFVEKIAEEPAKRMGGAFFITITGAALIMHKGSPYIAAGIFFVLMGMILFYRKQREKRLQEQEAHSSSSHNGVNNSADSGMSPKTLLWGACAFGISIIAGFLNPYTYHIFSYPFTFLGDSFYKQHLIEWIPPDLLGRNLPFFISVLVLIAGASLLKNSLRVTDYIVLTMFSYLGLSVIRHGVLYSIAAVPIAGMVLQGFWNHISEYLSPVFHKIKKEEESFSLCLIILLLCASAFVYFAPRQYRAGSFLFPGRYKIQWGRLSMERELFPVSLLKFLEANQVPGPIFNPYEWGGYFIWQLYPRYQVFIDGRANTIYPEEVYKESIYSMKGEPVWKEVMDKYNIKAALCNKYLQVHNNHFLPLRLEEDENWQLIYEDEISMLFVKNIPDNYQLIKAAEEGELIYPDTPFSLNNKAAKMLSQNLSAEAERYLHQALTLNPNYLPAKINLAFVYVSRGELYNAEEILFEVSKLYPQAAGVHYNLGRIYHIQGRIKKAEKYFKKELQITPDHAPARQILLEMRGNKPK